MLVIVFLGLLAVAPSSELTFLSVGANIITQQFDALDDNKDGMIQKIELYIAFNNDDLNKDGFLSPEEFAAGLHLGSPPLSVDEAFKFFDKGDKQENNLIDLSGVDNFLPSLNISLTPTIGEVMGGFHRLLMKDLYSHYQFLANY